MNYPIWAEALFDIGIYEINFKWQRNKYWNFLVILAQAGISSYVGWLLGSYSFYQLAFIEEML